jgi:hypothetical protein
MNITILRPVFSVTQYLSSDAIILLWLTACKNRKNYRIDENVARYCIYDMSVESFAINLTAICGFAIASAGGSSAY